jgi:hypothetical protein
MNELDNTLGRLATAPVHVSPATFDDAVLAGLALRRSQIPASTIGLTAVAALMVGVASATLPTAPAEAASVTPFGAPSALAPSTLLGNSK